MEKTIIDIIIVDDDKLLAQLLFDFLSSKEEIQVLKVLHSGNQLLAHLLDIEQLPEIILMDLKMKDGDGTETIEQIKRDYPNLKVIALSSYYQVTYIGHIFKLGFSAFLPKSTGKEDLLKVIHAVSKNGHYFSEEQVMTLRNQINTKSPSLILEEKDKLSSREVEVLRLICQQYTAKEIAKKLYVSTKTVEAHKSNLFIKIGARNTAGLIVYAIQHKIVKLEELMLL